MEQMLKDRVQAAMANGTLNTLNWDIEPLLQVKAQAQMAKPVAVPNQFLAFQVGPPTEGEDERKKKMERSQRFQ